MYISVLFLGQCRSSPENADDLHNPMHDFSCCINDMLTTSDRARNDYALISSQLKRKHLLEAGLTFVATAYTVYGEEKTEHSNFQCCVCL